MSIKNYIKHHTVVVTFTLIVAIIIMIIAGRAGSHKLGDSTGVTTKQVVLVDASTFRDDLSTVSVDGVVESTSQVDIKSQISAPISNVYVSVGDTVNVGQTIVELQNADIRAQLEQARANLMIARGQYTSESSSVSVVYKNTIDKIRDSYAKTEDIINAQIGEFVSVYNQNTVHLQSYVTDYSLISDLNVKQIEAKSALQVWKKSADSLSDTATPDEVEAALTVAQQTLTVESDFLTVLSKALVNATGASTPANIAQITAWKTISTNARASVSSFISSLTSAGNSLVTNSAQISGAEAGVKNLQAQLAKTIIVAPITGKIAALPLRTGEFASAGQLITTVVGAGGLQVKAYASSEDLDRISKNASAIIAGSISGVVTAVSPSVSQLNKKVEVTIAVSGTEKNNLVVGQNVQAKIIATKLANATQDSTRATYYILPIQNVKIIPGEAYVFTLDANMKVVKNPVTLGEVKGEFVEVKSGMTDDMKIISPVYELTEGDTVKI